MATTTTCWAFRIDYNPEEKGELKKLGTDLFLFLDGCHSEWSLTVLEDVKGVNHHVQGMFLASLGSLKPTALRARFKKLVPKLEGNKSYSMKHLNPEGDANFPFLGMERYLCKGSSLDELPRLLSVGTTAARYTPDRIAELHQQYWDTAAALSKKRKVRMFDEVLRKAKSNRIERREDIARLVITELAEQDKVISINGVRGLTNLVYYKVSPDPQTAMTVLLELVMERN